MPTCKCKFTKHVNWDLHVVNYVLHVHVNFQLFLCYTGISPAFYWDYPKERILGASKHFGALRSTSELKPLKKTLFQKRRWSCDFPSRKTPVAQKHRAISRQEKMAFSTPRRVVLGLPSPSRRVCANGWTYVRTYVRTHGRTVM